MRFKLKCKCGATCWVSGQDEPDVNAVSLDDNVEWAWEPNMVALAAEWSAANPCQHDDFEIVDQEYDEPSWMD